MSSVSAAVTRPDAARRVALPVGVTAVLAAATAYTGIRNPHEPGFFPSCVFYSASGYYCPGCGGLRAVHDLVNGDLAGALQMNPLVVLGVIPAGIFLIGWWLLSVTTDRVRPLHIPTWVGIAIPVALGAYWVVRNLEPFAPYLSPGG
jgi:hypothetical protein